VTRVIVSFEITIGCDRGARLDWTKIQMNVRGAVVTQAEYDAIPLPNKATLRLKVHGDGLNSLVPEIEVFSSRFFSFSASSDF
jgi:hypothetical protein